MIIKVEIHSTLLPVIFSSMRLSKLLRVRVRMRVINQSNKSAGNQSGVYALLGFVQQLLRRGLDGQFRVSTFSHTLYSCCGHTLRSIIRLETMLETAHGVPASGQSVT